MFKFAVLALFAVASAEAGLISAAPGLALAAGPALPATLLGRTTITAPETTIVKQQVVVDQPEIRYRAIPTAIQTAPIVQTIAAPAVIPQVRTIAAAPAVIPQVRTIAAAPAVLPAVRTIAAPAIASPLTLAATPLAANTLGLNTIAGTPFAVNSLIAGVQSQTLLASPTSTLLAAPGTILLKK